MRACDPLPTSKLCPLSRNVLRRARSYAKNTLLDDVVVYVDLPEGFIVTLQPKEGYGATETWEEDPVPSAAPSGRVVRDPDTVSARTVRHIRPLKHPGRNTLPTLETP